MKYGIDYLLSHPASFQREIAEGCLIEPATLSPILGKMEQSGLIRRDKADGNRKNSVVSLTAPGLETGHRIRRLFKEVEDSVCDGVSEEDRNALMRSLVQIQKNCCFMSL